LRRSTVTTRPASIAAAALTIHLRSQTKHSFREVDTIV
jgi:hypothetical protein